MPRRILLTLTVAIGVCIFTQRNARAGGWGPYFSWGRDAPTTGIPDTLINQIDYIFRSLPRDILDEAKRLAERTDVDTRVNHLTFGVMYDSAPSRDKLLNYRFTLGFDLVTTISLESARINITGAEPLDVTGIADRRGVDLDKTGYGVTMGHTLGFGLVQEDFIKWWLGPGIRFNFNYYDLAKSFEGGNLSIGGGPETGINLHIRPDISICISGGIHWNAFAYGMGSKSQNLGSFVWGNGPFYFVQVSGLFHTGDDIDPWQAQAPASAIPTQEGQSPVLTPLPDE